MNHLSMILRMTMLILRDQLSRTAVSRQPEPTSIMTDRNSVQSFHDQGDRDSVMAPVHHLNALCLNRMVPQGGTLLDLGCGSGQFLRYFAQCRPDVRLIGLDLSNEMIDTGRAAIEQAGLSDRIELRTADIRAVGQIRLPRLDAISCIYTLHHLPEPDDLLACLAGLASLRRTTGCGVWIFDHALPRHPRTAERFPAIATPTTPVHFQNDSCNSIKASFEYRFLSGALDNAGTGAFEHVQSRPLRLFQAHWMEPESNPVHPASVLQEVLWQEPDLCADTRRQYKMFRRLFPNRIAGRPPPRRAQPRLHGLFPAQAD